MPHSFLPNVRYVIVHSTTKNPMDVRRNLDRFTLSIYHPNRHKSNNTTDLIVEVFLPTSSIPEYGT